MKKDVRVQRVITFLDRKELDFLDELIKDLYFEYGIKIPRARLIEEIIEGVKEKGEVDKKEIEQELVERFKKEV